MSTTAKTGIALVIALVVIIIGWSIFGSHSNTASTPAPVTTENQVATTTTVASSTPKVSNTADTGLSASDDTSTTALQNDIDAFGKQMTGLNDDSSNIDQGMNK